MYTYDQTIGKKESDDVASMLSHFLDNYLNNKVKTLHIFADSCGGQNKKNHTIIKFLHYVCAFQKRFESVTVTFPVRDHSYMETDKSIGLIPKSAKAKTPDGWRAVLEVARVKPSPFEVVKCEQSLFKVWSNFLSSNNYKNKFSFPLRPIKQLRFTKAKALSVEHRDSYNGGYFTTNIRLNKVGIEIEKKRRPKKATTY